MAPEPIEAGYETLGSVPGAVALADAGDGRLFVATKSGAVWRLVMAGGAPSMVLDLSAEVATGTEQGLLGVAVDDAGQHLYLSATMKDETAQILEYSLTASGPDVATRRIVLMVDDPNPTHNGGRLAFDDEGMLLLGLGDRGDGDRTGAAQDLGSLFGKLLRIDPRASTAGSYGIPQDNPFVDRDGARAEIWAYGFRNPWGWSLDRMTGDLWVADVGQLCFEEISHAGRGGRGANFGWSFLEGGHEFLGPVLGPGGEPDASADVAELGQRPDDLVAPVLEYDHSPERCSVIGGYVYRGSDVPALAGQYLWADLCQRAIFTLRQDADGWVRHRLAGDVPSGVVAFGEDREGEIYLISLDVGAVKIVAG